MYAVIIGDVHLRDDEFNPHRMRILEDLAERFAQPVEERAGVWVLLGDLNHALMRIADRNFLTGFLRELVRTGPVVIVRGNHDRIGDLDVFARLIPETHLVYAPTTFYCLDDKGGRARLSRRVDGATVNGFRLRVLPYIDRKPSDADVPARFDELIGQWDADCLEAQRHGAMTVGHMNVAGALASTGQPQIGREFELSQAHVELLARQGPVFMGHIHKPQFVGSAVMVGSVCQQDWGEEGEEKRIVVYDSSIDEPGKHAHQVVPVPGPKMLTVSTYTNPDGTIQTAGMPVDDWPSHLRVRVGYNPVGQPPDFEALRRQIPSDVRVKFVGVPDEVGEVRCREIAEASDLDDKVAAYCAVQGIEFTPALAARLDDLLAAEAMEAK